jgi:hypothetical protein
MNDNKKQAKIALKQAKIALKQAKAYLNQVNADLLYFNLTINQIKTFVAKHDYTIIEYETCYALLKSIEHREYHKTVELFDIAIPILKANNIKLGWLPDYYKFIKPAYC